MIRSAIREALSEGSPSTVVELPPQVTRRAFELLAAQPLSVSGLPPEKRDQAVVTAVSDDAGHEHVVSRFGDAVWDMRSMYKTLNTVASEKVIVWPQDIPSCLLLDAKAALYTWLRRGRQGWARPSGATFTGCARAGIRTLRYLSSQGLSSFEELKPIHLADHIDHLWKVGKLEPHTIFLRLQIVDLVWAFRDEVERPMRLSPWGNTSLLQLCGANKSRKAIVSGKTPVIPPSVQAPLFNYAEAVVRAADAEMRASNGDVAATWKRRFTQLRDAVLYLLQISTGMRNSESTGVRRDGWRSEVRKGITYHWVETVEHKTGKGLVEFLAPPELITALAVLQRAAEPLQERLRCEIEWLETMLAETSPGDRAAPNGTSKNSMLQRLAEARASRDKLFLRLDGKFGDAPGSHSRVGVLSQRSCVGQLNVLAKAAGVDWKMANHQCRRTFAWNVANSRLGRRSLIFLKWQFKHSTISMTQLYAANPLQDESLYDEFFDEVVTAKTEIVSSWFDDETPLAGGAGRRIMQSRAIPIADRENLLRHTAEHVNIRATGHGWCLAEQRGCVGEGLYEASRCADCGSAVIDQSHGETWRSIHLQNLELAKIDCGPAVAQRANREIARSSKVLQELGVTEAGTDE